MWVSNAYTNLAQRVRLSAAERVESPGMVTVLCEIGVGIVKGELQAVEDSRAHT